MHLAHVAIDESRRLADAFGFVLDDCPEQFQVLWSGNPVDVDWVVNGELEERLRRLAPVEGLESIFQSAVVTLSKTDMQCPGIAL